MSTKLNSLQRESLISKARDVLRPKRARRLGESSPVVYDNDGDSWTSEEHGEDYRYGQRQAHHHAKRAYQAAAAIAHQAVTHAPFYMEDIGLSQTEKDQRADPPLSPPSELQAQLSLPRRSYRPTRFYPEGGQDDRIQPIRRVGRTQLQKILPSYELSTAETRESGLGPSLEPLD